VRFLPVILLLVLAIYSWVEIAQSDPRQVRMAPRALWAMVVFVPLIGPVAWLTLGRPNGTEVKQRTPRPRPRTVGPDDDPDFLRGLDHRPPPDDDGLHT